MRDKEYKVYTYRLDDGIAKRIKDLKIMLGTSYNLLLQDMLDQYQDKKLSTGDILHND